MTVMHRGQVYVIPVQPGPNGLQQFQENIRNIFGYDQEVEINLSFGCTVPGSAGEMLTLEGCGAFDAAVHCAAVSAGLLASRNKRKRDAPQAAEPGASNPQAAEEETPVESSNMEQPDESVTREAAPGTRTGSIKRREPAASASGSKRFRACRN